MSRMYQGCREINVAAEGGVYLLQLYRFIAWIVRSIRQAIVHRREKREASDAWYAIHPKGEAIACSHVMLVPRWDSVQDMGIEAKATLFVCDSCHKEFSPVEALALRKSD